jgi:cytochrome c oxidase subunit II
MRYRFRTFYFVLIALFAAMSAFAQSSPRRIEVHARRFSFVPSEITVQKGEPVIIALTSDDVSHSLLVEGLNINTAVSKGRFTDLTVTPMATGDFKGRCGRFCGSGHGSMIFVIHVVEK